MRIIKYPLFYVIGISIYLTITFRWLYALKFLILRPKAKKIIPPSIPRVYVDKEGKTLISVVQGEDEYMAIKECIELLGGLEKLDVEGKSILIKPNIVNRYPSPANTNPRVIKGLIQLLMEAGASKILVGDMSAIFALPTIKNAMKSGIWEVICTEPISFIPFEDYGWVEVDTPEGRFVKKAIVSEIIYTADRVINVPVIKTHEFAHYTISLKNFVGATHPSQRPYFIAPESWDEIVAELNTAYTPHLNILDGTKIFVDKGPTKGKVAIPNLIIATEDRIAADVVGLSVIKAFGGTEEIKNKSVWEQRQIQAAIKLNLGVNKPSNLRILSECLGVDRSRFNELIQEIYYYLEEV